MTKWLAGLVVVVMAGAACQSGGGSSAVPSGGGEVSSGSLAEGGSQPPARQSGERGAAASSATVPKEPPKPKFQEVTIPSGTSVSLTLLTAVASDSSRVEDTVKAKVSKPVVVDGVTVVPEGAEVQGSVLEANESGRVKGRASVAFRFSTLHAWNDTYDIRTSRIAREAQATKGDDAKKVGIGAGAGALVGALAGGKKGAALGGAIGAGAGTGVVLATKGDEVRLAPGGSVTATIQEAVKILVPVEDR